MEARRKLDTKDLESKVAQLQKNLAFAGQSTGADSPTLINIIHHPGWTTIIDVQLASQILDAMNQQAVAMQGLRDTLQAHVTAAAAN
jgi:hypothetical protein